MSFYKVIGGVFMKISVIGAGAWGTAISKSLADKFDFNIFYGSLKKMLRMILIMIMLILNI